MSKEGELISQKNINIVTVGGGTGSPVVHEALFSTGKVSTIDAVVTPFDNGGATGRRRDESRGEEVAHSDSMRVLLSLTRANGNPEAKAVMDNWFLSRHPVTDRVLGQEIMEQKFDKKTAYANVEEDMTRMGIHVRGRVLPASTESSNILFTTRRGRVFKGEKHLDQQAYTKDTVASMRLSPEVPGFGPAKKALREAEIIIFSTGSLHGSVLANMLPDGNRETMARTEAPFYYVTPMTSTRNETHHFTPIDFANKIEEYAGRRPTGLIVPSMTREQFENEYPRAADLYDTEHSHFLGWTEKELKDAEKDGITIVTHDALALKREDGAEYVRHNPKKLGEALSQILPK